MVRSTSTSWSKSSVVAVDAGTLLAGLAVILVPIPFVWSRHGRLLRERSPWAREHMDDLDGDEEDEQATP